MKTHRKSRRGRVLVATALGTTLLAGAVATAMAGEGSPGSGNSSTPALLKAATTGTEPVSGLIVGYKSKAQEAHSEKAVREDIGTAAAKTGEKLSYKRRLGIGAALVSLGGVQPAKDVAKVMNQLRADSDVSYVVPDSQVPTSDDTPRLDAAAGNASLPSDGTDYASKQWNLSDPKVGMDVPDAWRTSTGKGVTVAVLDTGITKHSDLDANVVPGPDFISDNDDANDGDGRDSDPSDPGDFAKAGQCPVDEATSQTSSWHGTHIAGIVAALDNGKGTVGVAPDAKLQPIRVLGSCITPDSDIIDAITWASGGSVPGVPDNSTPAKVINMSLGSEGPCTPPMQSAVDQAVQRGSTIVVAAGNQGSRRGPQDAHNFDWASCNHVITVAATDRKGDRAFYSNFGSVTVAAPGGDTTGTPENGILSTSNSGQTAPAAENYRFEMGTSQATAHISGLAALMLSVNPELTPAEIATTIQANARPIPGTCEGGCGAGLADAAKTVEAVAKGDSSAATDSPVTPPSDSPSDSPSDAPSSPASLPASPSDGTGTGAGTGAGTGTGADLSACLHNDCHVEVTAGDTIQLDGAAGVDELSIDSVSDNTVAFTGSSGNGSQQSSDSQTAPGQSQINNLVVDIISVDGDRATIRLS
ncbi:S8 family serine peptidase [Streptomyces sp. NPDC001795]|uniref:S8 family serine peptidase n=1 Tax=Streptomyces sp. NPDC001795 TaxID=3154525 RepID=UPI0033229DE0